MLRTGTKERLQRWVEHLSEILNRDDPTNPAEEHGIVESEDLKEIDRKMAITRGQARIEEDKSRESRLEYITCVCNY